MAAEKTSETVFYLYRCGQQTGPHAVEWLKSMARGNTVGPSDMIWREGWDSWRPLSSVPGVITPKPPPAPQNPLPPEASRRDTPEGRLVKPIGAKPIQHSNAVQSTETDQVDAYFAPTGRVGRGTYLFRNLANSVGLVLLAAPFIGSQSDGAAIWRCLLWLMWVYLFIVTAGKRLHDLNYSAWFSPIVFIPLVPLFFLFCSGTKGPNKYGPQPGNKSPTPKEQAKTSGWPLLRTNIIGFVLGFVVAVIAHAIEAKSSLFVYTNSVVARRGNPGNPGRLLMSVAESLPITAESLCSVVGMPIAEDIANKRIPYPGGSFVLSYYHSQADTPEEKFQGWMLNYLEQHPELGASGIMPNSIIQDLVGAIRGRPLSDEMIQATAPYPNLTRALSTTEIIAGVWWVFWFIRRGQPRARKTNTLKA